jgi:hypothetical protein
MSAPRCCCPPRRRACRPFNRPPPPCELAYGCAFACHEQNPRSDGIYAQKGGLDVYLNANYYTSGATGYQTYYLLNASTGKVYDPSGNLMSGYAWNNSSSRLTYGGSQIAAITPMDTG